MGHREKKSRASPDCYSSYLNTVFYFYMVMLVFAILLSLTSQVQATSTDSSSLDFNNTSATGTGTGGVEESSSSSVLISKLYREAYRNFTVDIFRDFLSGAKLRERTGPEGFSPLSIAHLLSVIHEKIWAVPTTGFGKVLYLKDEEIHGSYKDIIGHLSNDSNVYMHSNVHTSTKGIFTPPKVEELKTVVSYIDYNHNRTNEAIMKINSMVAAQAFGKIYDPLIPLGGWYGTPIYDYTLGVFLNTFYFNSEWLFPFFSIGKKKFGEGRAKFLEASGKFEVNRHKSYTAVRIPLKHNGKSLVLIKPRQGLGKTIQSFANEDLHEFLSSMDDRQKSAENMKQIKIQIPSFNFSQFNRFPETLTNLGITESFCQYKPKLLNTLEAFVQSFFGHIAEDKFEIAAATGSSLNNVDKFYKHHSDYDEDSTAENENEASTLEFNFTDDSVELPIFQEHFQNITTILNLDQKSSESPITGEESQNELQSKRQKKSNNIINETPDVPIVSVSQNNNDNNLASGNLTANIGSSESNSTSNSAPDKYETVTFDTPFIWYFQDDNLGLGPLLLGTVESAPQINPHVIELPPEGFEWFPEAHKYILWSCPDGAYLSEFSNHTGYELNN